MGGVQRGGLFDSTHAERLPSEEHAGQICGKKPTGMIFLKAWYTVLDK